MAGLAKLKGGITVRTEKEVRERIEYWKGVLAGVLKGEETTKTLRHLIQELEWVLGERVA